MMYILAVVIALIFVVASEIMHEKYAKPLIQEDEDFWEEMTMIFLVVIAVMVSAMIMKNLQ